LLRDQVSFWGQRWSQLKPSSSGLPFLCYYVDGNTKPLWSQKRVKQCARRREHAAPVPV
jgi:hypothetical protein